MGLRDIAKKFGIGVSPDRSNPGRKGSATIGVLTVIQEEFEEISGCLGTTSNIPGTPYYVRQGQNFKNCDLVLASLDGRGNIKSSNGTTLLIEQFRPEYILLVGIAGGVAGRDGTGVGDVVIPDFVDYYEMRKLVPHQSLKRYIPYDHPAYALRTHRAWPIARSADWLSRVTMNRPVPDGVTPKVLHGMLISGEKVLSDDTADYQREILKFYDNAIAVDMESFGLACTIYSSRLTRHYNPQYMVIRGISDLLHPLPDEAPEQDRTAAKIANNAERALWKRYAAHTAGAFASTLVDHILANPQSNE